MCIQISMWSWYAPTTHQTCPWDALHFHVSLVVYQSARTKWVNMGSKVMHVLNAGNEGIPRSEAKPDCLSRVPCLCVTPISCIPPSCISLQYLHLPISLEDSWDLSAWNGCNTVDSPLTHTCTQYTPACMYVHISPPPPPPSSVATTNRFQSCTCLDSSQVIGFQSCTCLDSSQVIDAAAPLPVSTSSQAIYTVLVSSLTFHSLCEP